MATNEEIVTGRKFRKLIDEATKLWQRISFWTKASDVEFDDGKDAEIKVGAIDGITDSLASTSSRIAASAKAINTLNNNLGGYSFGTTADGKPGYRKPGADTVIPFKSGAEIITKTISGNGTRYASVSFANLANYKSLTVNNFALKSCNIDAKSNEMVINQNNRMAARLTYNSSTGILTMDSGNESAVFNTSSTVVCFF